MKEKITDKALITKKWGQKVSSGKPNPGLMGHQIILEGILEDFNWSDEEIFELFEGKKFILLEAPEDKKIKWKDEDGESRETSLDTIKQYKYDDDYDKNKNKQLAVKAAGLDDKDSKDDKEKPGQLKGPDDFERNLGDDEPEEKPEEKPKDKDDEKAENTPVSQESIDAIDGSNKTNALNGKEKVPGTTSSATNEIGTGYAMACLDESPDDVDACLDGKLNKTKFGKASKNNSPSKRKHMIRTARREKRRVNETIRRENMNSETTAVSHVGGSKGSLNSTVNHLQEKGVTEVNGIPFDGDEDKLFRKLPNGEFELDKDGNRIALPVEVDENNVPKNYAQVILNGGGGGDPTDTLVVMVDDSSDPPKCAINHTSNKMTTSDIQSNSSPVQTVKNNGNAAKKKLREEDHEKVDKLEENTLAEIEKQRVAQIKYIRNYAPRLEKFANDDDKLEKIYLKLTNDLTGNPKGISKTKGKYAKIALKGAKCDPKLMDNPDENKDEIKECIKKYLGTLENKKKLTQEDQQIITRLLSEESQITGESPENPPMTRSELNSFYEKQTDALNTQREELNKLGADQDPSNPTLGDQVFIDDLIKRMHLDIAEGHNPGGIPNQNFELIHGTYEGTTYRQDSDGNLYEKGEDGLYYKLDSDGKPSSEGVKKNKLEQFDCAIVGSPEIHRECLGLEEGEDIKDGFDVKYKEYKLEDGSSTIKALIYDRDGKVIATQTCRSRTGPGGAISDEMKWDQDYQDCMARTTKKLGYCE